MADFRASSLHELEAIAKSLSDELASGRAHPGLYISPILFRGQSQSDWPLQTTLERHGFINLPLTDYVRFLSRVKPAIESLLSQQFEFSYGNEEDKSPTFTLSEQRLLRGQYEFMVYLRHHGFPTPLLDWTHSLYIATYFAVSGQPLDQPCALYMYVENTGHGKGGVVGAPEIATMGRYVTSHKRHWLQQSEYTACIARNATGTWHFHSHESVFGGAADESDKLIKVEIDPSARKQILRNLDLMNVNEFSLFGTEEALMRTLTFREILADTI